MIKLELPFWLDGDQITRLKASAQAWWESAESWLRWPLLQLDAETCHVAVLDLLAWQRDITRYDGETESLFRLRVKYAFINAVDAGSVAGFRRILQRLGVGDVRILERQPDRDWDIVQLYLSDAQLSENPTLLNIIVHQYGRTCRRYELVATTELSLAVTAFEVSNDQVTLVARFDDFHSIGLALTSFEFNHDHMTLVTR
ncbi:phage tail protein [Pseudomonas triticifolii]|uniref:Phage tail protein n=1 Tax=Pseudomonas triticifolii TaxID=2762592 RepID=A0ABR7BKI4_9PSED|nr:phage tail protein [Pseudomonas triticifolii]MBC3957677.1 phage tail protein [Pseudomonas triticifolii]